MSFVNVHTFSTFSVPRCSVQVVSSSSRFIINTLVVLIVFSSQNCVFDPTNPPGIPVSYLIFVACVSEKKAHRVEILTQANEFYEQEKKHTQSSYIP
uniref:AlNc14C343G10828 protein n=1 Tax=Albugo laibachii Nc14 TaxID=890382 RepID=F0WX70_9STRA|nr:AlNc14C343G10828 [Albugo laibachii Nc14]|eukprot:CCA26061.1 AlNc14C343G10828 [Albugo laibachii Nc14]